MTNNLCPYMIDCGKKVTNACMQKEQNHCEDYRKFKKLESICEYYKYCPMPKLKTRDCTKPAYEDCETYQFWKQQKVKFTSIPQEVLGIGATVNLEDAADNSTKV